MSSEETEEPPKFTVEMANCSAGNKPQSERFKKHQPECEAVQLKESDKDVPINAAEKEAVSPQVLTQENIFTDSLKSANVYSSQIDTAYFVVIPEVKQTNMMTAETEEHSAKIKNEQDQQNLSGSTIPLYENLNEKENAIRTISNPGFLKYPSLQNKLNEEMPFQIEEPRIDLKAIDDHLERLSDTMLEHVEDTCVDREILLQATDEVGSLDPPAKKKMRKRMGMCGLGDKKRKLFSDGQHCRKALGPECSKNAFKVLVLETNNAAVMAEGKTKEAEIENKYDIRKCTTLMSDEVTTDQSPKENTDGFINSILNENTRSITMDDKVNDEQIVFLVSTEMVETTPSSCMEKNKLIQYEPSVAAASSDQDTETGICGEEPIFSGLEITNSDQDIKFNPKLEILSEKHNYYANRKLDENLDETEINVAQNVSLSLICAVLEKNKSSVITFKDIINTIPAGVEARKSEVEKQHPSNLAASEKSRLSEKGLGCPYTKNTSILEVASTFGTPCAKDQGEIDMFIIAVSDCAGPVEGDSEDAKVISKPLAPPTDQEDHIQCFLDQNTHATVTPIVAEQQFCNLTPDLSELLQETDKSFSPWLYSLTDSQIHKIALSMEQEDQPVLESREQSDDATDLVRGLIGELSSLNRTVMAAHRKIGHVRCGKLPKATAYPLCDPCNTEK